MRVLTAMTEAVGQDGYRAARVADVITRAGVSRKTFYEHFEDKEQCFIAAYLQSLDGLLATTSEAFDAEDEWVDGLRAGLTAMLTGLAGDPAVARIVFGEALTAGPKAVESRNEAMGRFARFFESGRPESKRELPAFVALGVLGGIREIIYREVIAGRARELPQLVPDLMYMIVLPYAGPEAATRELERGRGRASDGSRRPVAFSNGGTRAGASG